LEKKTVKTSAMTQLYEEKQLGGGDRCMVNPTERDLDPDNAPSEVR
jgi:hypothetical protein